ncbi:MAG: hypothetical protein Q9222_003386 [Ikaeria aurantiellina]
MKIIITGATGFIGAEVLRSALAHPNVTSIVALSRRSLSISHPKLTVVIISDFLNYSSSVLEACAGAEACIWSLGVARSLSPEANRKVNLEYTLAAARAFTNLWKEPEQPKAGEGSKGNFRFVYLSGMFTERDRERTLWFMSQARKIRASHLQKERNDVLATYIARPGGVLATNSLFPAALEPLAKAIAVDDLAFKMLDTAINGHKAQIMEVDVLREDGKRRKREMNNNGQ